MRFPARTPCRHYSSQISPAPRRRAGFRALALFTGLVAGLIVACGLPGAGLAEDLDLALYASEQPFGEAVAAFDFGGVALTARHVEYLGYLNRAQRDNPEDQEAETDPLVRSSRLGGAGLLDLDDGIQLPVGLTITLDEWQSGHRDLRMTAEGGLQLESFSLDHSFTVTTRFPEQGGQERHSAGRLALGLAALSGLGGGVQEGIIEYDVAPLAQVTLIGMNSEWRFADGSAVQVAVTHRPLEAVAEARLGFRQPLGAFELTSDIAADDAGAYAVGFTLALPLGPAPEPVSWSLSKLIGNLRGAAQAPGWTPDGGSPFAAN